MNPTCDNRIHITRNRCNDFALLFKFCITFNQGIVMFLNRLLLQLLIHTSMGITMLSKEHKTRRVLIKTCHDMHALVRIIIADKMMFDKISHGIIVVNTWNTGIAIRFIDHQEVIILIDDIQVKRNWLQGFMRCLVRDFNGNHISFMDRISRKLLLAIDPNMTTFKLNLGQKSF